jgi:hypothetical protein
MDGNVDASYTAGQLWATASAGNQLWIGGSADTGDGNTAFNGLIDEVYVFGSALSSSQMLNLMSAVNVTSGQLPAASPVSLAPAGTLDLSGLSQTVASLSDIGGSGGKVTNSATINVTLTVSNNTATTSTFSGVINDAGGNAISLVKAGNYNQELAAVNGYSGLTTVAGGSLFVNGSIGSGSATVANSTLGGKGTINGATTINVGGILAPGVSGIGTLTFSNSLTLNPGSKTIMNISHDLHTNNVVSVAGTSTWGGALVVSNADDPLQGGDVFPLFRAPGFTGNFSSITLPALSPGLYWNTNTFKATGNISVGIETPPVIGNVSIVGGRLVLNGSGGITNGTYYLLTSTNIAAPLTEWTPLQTNQFDGSGSFNFTIPINQNSAQSFYLLKIP